MGQRSRKRSRSGRPGATKTRRAATASAAPAPAPDRESRSEARNAEARAALEPLAPGERPGVVTLSALLCAVGAVVLAVGWAAGWFDSDKEGGQSSGVIASILILAVAGAGMWRGRYWAVLGFQAILALNIIVMFLLLILASSVTGALIALAVVIPCSLLFYKLVRALARLQMPERPG